MDSKLRFSEKVAAYKAGRPGYPNEAYQFLSRECGSGIHVADIGAGTGIFTLGLLKNGFSVKAVEPNREMRDGMAEDLSEEKNLEILAGSAEETGLEDASIDLVTVAQAFHWFDRTKARKEFQRILKPSGHAALIWNDRLSTSSPFMESYEDLLRTFGTDYAQVEHRNIHPASIARFFGAEGCRLIAFPNSQRMNLQGLLNRLNSTSYVPDSKSPQYKEMIRHLNEIYDRYAIDDHVSFDYETLIYYGGFSTAVF